MCIIANAKLQSHFFTINVTNYKNCIVIIKNVPCEECGKKYYSNELSKQFENLVNIAKQLMREIAIIDYSKAAYLHGVYQVYI